MSGDKKTPLIQKGIWIKEQNGVLTMGTLDQENGEAVKLPEKLTETIFAIEDEMMEALYGKEAVVFDPSFVDVQQLFYKVTKRFAYQYKDVGIYTDCPENSRFEGDWDQLFDLLCAFVRHSIEYELKDVARKSIQMNASVVAGNFCLIYRDSGGMQHADRLQPQFDRIENDLKGEVSIKPGSGKGSYLDISIPGKAS